MLPFFQINKGRQIKTNMRVFRWMSELKRVRIGLGVEFIIFPRIEG